MGCIVSAGILELICATSPALAQTADDLKNDETTPGDVLVDGMGYSAQRFSPLTQIATEEAWRILSGR